MTSAYWDEQAETFDDEADHGLLDPAVRAAWAGRLAGWLPQAPGDVLDLGCGTGSLALLAAESGHRVTGVDAAPGMVARAREKLAGTGARVLVGDAAEPPVGRERFDVVLVRHVVWALPDPAAALRRWAGLLRPGGRFVLVEGRWGGAGIPAARLAELVAPHAARTTVEHLAHDARLWGKEVDDERYAIVAGTQRRHTEIVDVHLVLRRGADVLLARRAGTGYADGLLHAPSGHVEAGEDVRTALLREAAEETGLRIPPAALRVALVMQHRAPGGAARIGWFFEAELPRGQQPVNAEPEKCAELAWFPLDALPEDMVAYCRAGLEAYRAGERFVLHLHEPGDPIAYAAGAPGRAEALQESSRTERHSPAAGR